MASNDAILIEGTSEQYVIGMEENGKTATQKSKKPKKRANDDPEDLKREKKPHCDIPQKPGLFEKRWIADDEIAVLKGIYNNYKHSNFSYDLAQFFEVIKNDIHFDASKKQLSDKISKLKKKFKDNMKAGNRYTFKTAQEETLFDLSKLIWSMEVVDGSSSNDNADQEFEFSDNDDDGVIAKKLKVLKSYFRTVDDGNGKEAGAAEMKKYFILGLKSFEGSKKREMIQEYWNWYICKMDLIRKENDLIKKLYNLIISIHKTY